MQSKRRFSAGSLAFGVCYWVKRQLRSTKTHFVSVGEMARIPILVAIAAQALSQSTWMVCVYGLYLVEMHSAPSMLRFNPGSPWRPEMFCLIADGAPRHAKLWAVRPRWPWRAQRVSFAEVCRKVPAPCRAYSLCLSPLLY